MLWFSAKPENFSRKARIPLPGPSPGPRPGPSLGFAVCVGGLLDERLVGRPWLGPRLFPHGGGGGSGRASIIRRTTRSGTSTSSSSVWQRQIDQGNEQREQQAAQQRCCERFAETLVVLAAARPWHDQRARGKHAHLPLDDPLLLAPLLFFLRLEDVALEQIRLALLPLDHLEDLLSAVLDLAQALLEEVHAAAHAADVILAGASDRAVAPEELGSADLIELLQRSAHVVQQAMLPPFGRQAFQLGVDRAQIAHETVELLAGLRELRE